MGQWKCPCTVGGPAQWLLCTSTDHGHSYTLGRGQFPKSIKPGPLHICLISGNLNGLGIHTPNCFGRCWDFFTYRPPLKKSQKLSKAYFVFKAGWDLPRLLGQNHNLLWNTSVYGALFGSSWKTKTKIIKASLKFSKGIFSRESGCPESLKGEHERHVIMGLAERRCALFIHNQSYFLV